MGVAPSDDFFDPMTWVVSPGLTLCGVEGSLITERNPEGCYAKIPAAIYIDMQMFKIDKPEDCACGLSLDAKNDAPPARCQHQPRVPAPRCRGPLCLVHCVGH